MDILSNQLTYLLLYCSSIIRIQIYKLIAMKLKVLIILLGFGFSTNAQSLSKIWTTADGLKTPESVLFDETTNQIFVSNIDGDPTAKDGNGFISILNPDGKIKNLHWVTGLNAPKGQAIFDGNLYVADIDELVVINIEDAKILKRYKVEKAIFLNDVAVAKDGTVFVSDTRVTKVYALKDGSLNLWLDDPILVNPNGLWVENDQLYIGTDKLLQVDIPTKKISVLVNESGGIDGLEKLQDGNFIYSNWPGRIFITKGKESIKLLDTVGAKNTADIDFIPGKNLVLVPTFQANSVEAYTLKQ